MPKINHHFFSYLVLFFTIIKILYSFHYGDDTIEMEWEIIYKNLINFGEFSYHQIDGKRLPTVYMPPLYPYFLFCFSFLELNQFLTIKLILFTQCILSAISLFIFNKILRNFFDEQKSYIISILYFILPINFYAASQISSVSIQVFCFIYFIYFLLNLRNLKDYILFGFFSGLLILVRGEFWLLFIIIIFFKIFTKIKLTKNYLISITVALLVVSPILFKNYKVFNQLVITKSFGYNLWRGNSEDLNINGNFHDMKGLKDNFVYSDENINKFDLYVDNFFLTKAKDNLAENPYKYAKHYINKFFAFSIFNYESNYPNYFNPMIFIPEMVISIFAILGIMKNFFKKKNYELSILILYYLALIPVFFVLPRYKLFIYPLYFIFAFQFFFYLSNIFSKKQ